MEKENLKLTSKISSLITDDLKKNTKHESLEHAAQILLNKKFQKKGWILKISSLQLKLSISGNLSVFILSETYNKF
jgi:hypothetical protein